MLFNAKIMTPPTKLCTLVLKSWGHNDPQISMSRENPNTDIYVSKCLKFQNLIIFL